jgi:hypothetical protein
MTNNQVSQIFSQKGVSVKRITQRLGQFIVTISWEDYLKVRSTEIDSNSLIKLKF